MNTEYFAINGVVMPAAEARISVLDLGFLRGVGAFETIPTYGGHPHAVAQHLARLWTTAARFGVAPCFSERELRRVIIDIRQRSGLDELRINVVVTPGDLDHGVFGATTPRWVVIARDQHPPSAAQYRDGVACVTTRGERLWPEHKTTAYLCGFPGLSAAATLGAHEALYIDDSDHLREGVTSNVLILRQGEIATPATQVLPGLTQAGLRPLAEAAGLRWSARAVTRQELFSADEVWLSSAVREVLPVVRIDNTPIGTGQVGPWAQRLRAAYHAQAIADAAADAQRFHW